MNYKLAIVILGGAIFIAAMVPYAYKTRCSTPDCTPEAPSTWASVAAADRSASDLVATLTLNDRFVFPDRRPCCRFTFPQRALLSSEARRGRFVDMIVSAA